MDVIGEHSVFCGQALEGHLSGSETLRLYGQHDLHGRDDGVGIPLDLLTSVFDKLATNPGESGTSLELAIVKRTVEPHGSEVSAESTHGAGGSCRFTIPTPWEG